MAFITVFSGSFCHGDQVTQLVAEKLGYTCLENKLFDEIKNELDISKDKLDRILFGSVSLFGKYTHEREKITARLKLILAKFIGDDNKILFHPIGYLIAGNISHVLKVLLIANHDYRVEQCVREKSISNKDADEQIRKDDQNLLELTKYLYDKSPYDESLFDIVIPMQDSSINEAAEMICKHAVSDKLKITPLSKKAVEDFGLAATVNMALSDKGHYVNVASKLGQVTITINEYVVRLKHLEDELVKIAKTVPGVTRVETITGPNFKAPAMNPWANIDIPPKILLVDDEKEYVHTLSERLETREIGTSVVYNGKEALDFVEKDVPDVMVLDLMMPGINGLEVLRQVKSEHPHVEVIILTGHGSDREESIARELGAFAYLKKPVDVDELAELMKEAYKKVGVTKNVSKTDDD